MQVTTLQGIQVSTSLTIPMLRMEVMEVMAVM
jgi:hypothetical protein